MQENIQASDSRQKSSGKLAEIFAKINMSELPAMSTHVQELISLTYSNRSAAYELSKVILKDYSLTNKVLQVVNSAYYSLGRHVSSISRAVTILGFDAVRDLATAIAIFEDFINSGVEKEDITKILTRSFLSALQARDLVVRKNVKISPEEAFICALLHNLGKIIVCIYLPDKYREIEQKTADGLAEETAAKQVLDDLTYYEIGEEVARFWNLSDQIITSMTPNPEVPNNKNDKKGYLQNISRFTNVLVDSVCSGQDITSLVTRFSQIVEVGKEEAIEMMTHSVEASEDISDSMRYGLAKLKVRSRMQEAEKSIKQGLPPSSARKKDDGRKFVRDAEEELDELPISKDKSVNDFIREITEIMTGSFKINDLYLNLLEGLYRGVGFDRVILGIVSLQPDRRVLVGRFGLGDIDPGNVSYFEQNLANEQYAISRCLKEQNDMVIKANAPGAFPAELKFLVKNRNVYLLPISLGKSSIGLIYLDRKAGRSILDENEMKAIKLFRDLAVVALQKISRNRK